MTLSGFYNSCVRSLARLPVAMLLTGVLFYDKSILPWNWKMIRLNQCESCLIWYNNKKATFHCGFPKIMTFRQCLWFSVFCKKISSAAAARKWWQCLVIISKRNVNFLKICFKTKRYKCKLNYKKKVYSTSLMFFNEK